MLHCVSCRGLLLNSASRSNAGRIILSNSQRFGCVGRRQQQQLRGVSFLSRLFGFKKEHLKKEEAETKVSLRPVPILHLTSTIAMSTSSAIPPPEPSRRLEARDGPLVWIDCEMTGLHIDTDRIIEIACIITDGELRKVDGGISYVIRTDKAVLDGMGQWCTDQHGSSGLTKACQDERLSHEHQAVREAVMKYITDRIAQPQIACLAGNTVHADAKFLQKEMPELLDHLHYRIVDVSSIKELVARWYDPRRKWTSGKGAHRALDDIEGSINELQYYRERFFAKR